MKAEEHAQFIANERKLPEARDVIRYEVLFLEIVRIDECVSQGIMQI